MQSNRINTILLGCLLFVAACTPSHNSYLDAIGSPCSVLSPESETDLEQMGIMMAVGISAQGDWLLIKESGSEYLFRFVERYGTDNFPVIRKGRGPGEMAQSSDAYCADGGFYLYENNEKMLLRMDVDRTVKARKAVLDTIGIYSQEPSFQDPVCLGEGFLSLNLMDKDAWYVYRDRKGVVVKTVGFPDYPEAAVAPLDWTFLSGGKFVSDISGRYSCRAMASAAALSFGRLTRDGNFEETARYEYEGPAVLRTEKGNLLDAKHAKRHFVGGCGTADCFYLLYSGQPMEGEDGKPVFEASHLVKYSLEGKLMAHYMLDVPLLSVCTDGNSLWGLTTYPHCAIIKYPLP